MRKRWTLSVLAALALAAAFAAPPGRAEAPATAPAARHAGLPREGLVAHWAGDGDAKDAVGKHHGKAGAGVGFTADRHGKAKGAFLFNGRRGSITVPDHDALDTDDAFTLSAWIKPAAYRDEHGHECVILSKYVHHLQRQGDYVLMFRASGQVKLGVMRSEDPYAGADLASGLSVPKDKWTHLAATFDRGHMSLYVDGRLVGRRTDRRVPHTTRAEYTGDDVCIGGLLSGHHFFRGAMDDVAIWKRALSVEEIRWVFNGVAPRGFVAPVRPPVIEREATADRVVLSNGQVLKGTIVNARFDVKTSVGRFTFEAGKLAGLARDKKPERLWVCLKDGQILAGAVATGSVRLKLSTGATLNIPLTNLDQVGWRRVKGAAAPRAAAARLLTLRTGERLIWKRLREKLRLRTPFGEIGLPLESVLEVRRGPGPGGRYFVRFANGTALSGILSPQRLTFELALGPKIMVGPGRLHGLTGQAKGQTPAGPAVLLTRRGDRLMGQVVDARLTVRTPFGEAPLPPASVRSFIFDPKQPGKVAARPWDGGVVTGTLVQRTVTFRIAAGVALKVPAADIASITRKTVLPPPEVVRKAQKLIARLGAPSYKDREGAARALIAMGKVIVPVLRPHLKSDDAEIRQRVRLILERLGAKVPKQ